MALAFFDLDKTLLRNNSANGWIRYELERGNISLRQAAWGIYYISRYHLGLGAQEEAYRRAIAVYRGQSAHELARRTADFYDSVVRNAFRPGARSAVEWHRGRGDALVLLTSSSNYMSELVTRDLRLDHYLCTRFEVDAGGMHTGRPIEPICAGDGKRTLAVEFARERGFDLADATFYTDSVSDLSTLEAVGRPMIVSPDRKLQQIAVSRGWRILDWSEAGDVAY